MLYQKILSFLDFRYLQNNEVVKNKRYLFQNLSHLVSTSVSVAILYTLYKFANINTIYIHNFKTKKTLILLEFPCSLMSTDSCPNEVHMKPFLTSAFKVFIWMFVATTKICTLPELHSYSSSLLQNITKAP